MTKLIYIVSTGHSGSTLLDLLVGSFQNVFSAGEFKYFTWLLYSTRNAERSLQMENICSCRKSFQECNVWTKIINIISEDENIDLINNPEEFKTTILSDFRSKTKSPPVIRLIRKVVSFEMYYLKRPVFSKWLKEFYSTEVSNVWKLIDTIGKITQADYVVDSSKNMLRYYLLKQARPNDVFLIVNSRDNFGFANSYIKRNIKPAVSLKRKKKFLNRAERLIKNLKPDYINTNYNDLVSNPESVLGRISHRLGLTYNSRQISDIDTRNYHLVAGNPMRFKGKLRISYDNSWEKQLSDEMIEDIKYYINKYKLNSEC